MWAILDWHWLDSLQTCDSFVHLAMLLIGQESMYELLDKQTTHTWVEEKEAYLLLKGTLRTIRPLLAHLRLRHLYSHVRTVENKAEKVYNRAPSSDSRPMCR